MGTPAYEEKPLGKNERAVFLQLLHKDLNFPLEQIISFSWIDFFIYSELPFTSLTNRKSVVQNHSYENEFDWKMSMFSISTRQDERTDFFNHMTLKVRENWWEKFWILVGDTL